MKLFVFNHKNGNFTIEEEKRKFNANMEVENLKQDSNTVTNSFFNHLKSLYLNEYPIYSRKLNVDNKNKYKKKVLEFKKREEYENPDEEIEELIDLIKEKKSPFFETVDWSKNGELLRETYIRDANKLNLKSIEKCFTSIRLNDKNISYIDCDLRNFTRLEELVLNCNQINECDGAHLPPSLKILDMSGNYLNDLTLMTDSNPKLGLQHLGLAYNWVGDIRGCFKAQNWPSLVSLDLSSNQFENLISLVDNLQDLRNLKVLMLYGNPISLLPGYRGYVVDSFPKLFALDDKQISKEERINCLDFKLLAEFINQEAEIKMNILQLKNLIVPEQPEIDENPEFFIYKYLVRFSSINDEYDSYSESSNFNQHKLHSMTFDNQVWKNRCQTYEIKYESTPQLDPATNIDLNEKGVIKRKYRSIKQLRDFFLDGGHIEVVELKLFYQSKDFDPESVQSDKKKGDKKGGKKDEPKKEEPKKDAKKKKTTASILDSYNLVKSEENVLAKFNLELNGLLDGNLREISKKYAYKLKEPAPKVSESVMKKSDPKKKDAGKASADKGSKAQKMKVEQNIDVVVADLPPMELTIKFELIDFGNFDEIKNYFSQKVSASQLQIQQPQ